MVGEAMAERTVEEQTKHTKKELKKQVRAQTKETEKAIDEAHPRGPEYLRRNTVLVYKLGEGHLLDLGSTYIASVYPDRKERCEWRHYRYSSSTIPTGQRGS